MPLLRLVVKQARNGDGDVEASNRLINFELDHVRCRNSTARQEGVERSEFSFHFGSPNSHPITTRFKRKIEKDHWPRVLLPHLVEAGSIGLFSEIPIYFSPWPLLETLQT
jgi:hypothetical protein